MTDPEMAYYDGYQSALWYYRRDGDWNNPHTKGDPLWAYWEQGWRAGEQDCTQGDEE